MNAYEVEAGQEQDHSCLQVKLCNHACGASRCRRYISQHYLYLYLYLKWSRCLGRMQRDNDIGCSPLQVLDCRRRRYAPLGTL